jgi:hypothetical protein
MKIIHCRTRTLSQRKGSAANARELELPNPFRLYSRCALCQYRDMEKFHLAYDSAIEKNVEWIVKFYGSESFRPVWHDERVIASRKKLGLPVYDVSGTRTLYS